MMYLAEHRRRRGVSQAQLARMAGISTTPIRRCESGGTIRPEVEAALAQALGADITTPLPGTPPVVEACETSGHCGHCNAPVVFGLPNKNAVRASTRTPAGEVVSTFWCRSTCFKLAHEKPARRTRPKSAERFGEYHRKPTPNQHFHLNATKGAA